jgi:hypothetical protein
VLGGRGDELRLQAPAAGEQLKGIGREPGLEEEVAEREPVEPPERGAVEDRLEQLLLLAGAEGLERLGHAPGPEPLEPEPALLGRQVEERLQEADLADPGPMPPDVGIGQGIGLDELAQVEPEMGDVSACQLVGGGDAHGAELAVLPVVEAGRADPAAVVLGVGLEEDDLAAATLQLEGGAEAGHPRPDDDHLRRAIGPGRVIQRVGRPPAGPDRVPGRDAAEFLRGGALRDPEHGATPRR